MIDIGPNLKELLEALVCIAGAVAIVYAIWRAD